MAEAAEFEFGIFEHDHRVLAAEFELHLLEMFAGQFADAPADMARSGKGDHGDIGIGAHGLAGFRAAG